MKKYTLFLSLAFLLSSLLLSCSDDIKPDLTSGSGTTTNGGTSTTVSVVGKWNMTGMSTITDKKTYTSTTSEIIAGIKQDSIDIVTNGSGSLVFGSSAVNTLLTKAYNFEFKSDSTFVTTYSTGKWSLSADKKTLTVISNGKSSKFEIISNTNSSLRLGLLKFTRTKTTDSFSPSTSQNLLDAILGLYGIYGPKPSETELDAMLSFQGTFNYTK